MTAPAAFLSRRDLLKGLLAGSAALALPTSRLSAMLAPPGAGPRRLVLVDLDGGNDGLNTVVPHGWQGGLYYSLYRDVLAVPPADVLALDGSLGLHPSLAPMLPHWDAGRLAIVQGVGWPDSSMSHAEARRVWQTADPDGVTASGWLARHMSTVADDAVPSAVSVSPTPSPLLTGTGEFVPAFLDLDEFVFPFDEEHPDETWLRRQAYFDVAAPLAASPNPLLAGMAASSGATLQLIDLFGSIPPFEHVADWPDAWEPVRSLKLVARLMAADIGLNTFYVRKGGFDTHGNQEAGGSPHSELLADTFGAIAAFREDLASIGLAQDTLIVVFSEFGRTPAENGSGGTDHGTSGPVFVLGDGVSGGFASEHPSLEPADLTADGELPLVVDMRDVIGTIVECWLGGDVASVLPGWGYTRVPVFT